MTDQTVDPLAFNILVQLVKNGTLDLDDIEEIADRLRDEGQDDASTAARGAFVEANATPEAEWRRSRLRVIDGGPPPDGGNAG